MAVRAPARPATWQDLDGRFSPEVLHAPKTCGDPSNNGTWNPVDPRIVGYLTRNVAGKPWADHLALVAAVLTARYLDVRTVEAAVKNLHARFSNLFAALGIADMREWQPELHLRGYFTGELLSDDAISKKARFWEDYGRVCNHVGSWLGSLPALEQQTYSRFLLPMPPHPYEITKLAGAKDWKRGQRALRKAETDAVVPQYAELRAEAHLRFNRITRLRQAYRDALAGIRQRGDTFSLPFSYEEGTPATERLHFRIWDRRSFVLAHREDYHLVTVRSAEERRAAFSDENNTPFLEFVRAERLDGDAPPEGLWFEELLRHKVLGKQACQGSEEEVHAKQEWLRAWGYGDEDLPDQKAEPLSAHVAGLLAWSVADRVSMAHAERHAEGVLVPVEPLYSAACFGLLAINLFTTTGMRLNEAMQVRLSEDCFARLTMPAPPGAKNQSPRTRWLFRLIPKGERGDKPQDYFIGEETRRILPKVANMLAEHYGLKSGGPLPKVKFNPQNGRAHRFGEARYLFQISRRHLPDVAITACMRFLLHGMVMHTRDGQPVVLKPHLLRHAFATHAVQVEKIPIDIVGAWLKQRNLDVTDYYSQPTATMIADASDQYLSRIAAHIDVERAVLRSPEELQRLYEEAKGKAGTLANVIGGHCISHGFCAAKFACIGCAGKVPDPSKRYQVEDQRKWATEHVRLATEEGLYPDARRMEQTVRECDNELKEMDMIERYRRDEAVQAVIRVGDISDAR